MIPRGDTARTLVISLKNRGIAYAPDENCRAVFTALKPDGTVVFNEASVSEGEIIYPLSAQTTAVEGALRCQIRLYGHDERLLISPGFSLEISEAVCADEPIVESRDEVSALTALVTDTNELIDTVRQSLTDGDFVPQISIGSVSTLPSGSMASVEIGGTKQAPVLNFAIPQGPEGQAQNLIPDSALSADSTRPVQNAVITAALSEKLDKSEFELSSKNFVKTEEFSEAVSNFVELEEIGNYLETKVDKVSGKGLSSNDFTDAEKSKLAAIEAGANKYTLPALGVGSSHLANSAVTAAKIAANAVSATYTATIPTSGWTDSSQYFSQTVTISGLLASDAPIVDLNGAGLTPTVKKQQQEEWGKVYQVYAAANSLTLYADGKPECDLAVKILCIRK